MLDMRYIIRRFYAIVLALGLVVSCVGVEQGAGLGGPEVLGEQARLTLSFAVSGQQLIAAQDSGRAPGPGNTSELTASPAGYPILAPGDDIDQGTSAGYVARDVWMIQYGGTTDDAPLVGLPRYIEISGSTTIQAVASTAVNTLIFIANTHDANLEFGDMATLGKLKRAHKSIVSERDCYGSNLYEPKDLVMSGKHEGVIATGSISVSLYRNVVRLDFTLANGAASGLNIGSVQLCNVPRRSFYTCVLERGSGAFPAESEYFDYPRQESATASTPGGAHTFTFYLPANERGLVPASTSSKLKSKHAPAFATYLRVEALDANLRGYVYKIYPGGNTINDYNLQANSRYTLDLSIDSPGDASTDDRVEDYGPVDMASANSFILNPAPSGAADRVFRIPIDKVNEFWTGLDPTLTIGPADEWTVELIWQDTPATDFIRFLDPVTGQATTTFTGEGLDQRVALTTPSSSQGNALIGIRKVGQTTPGYLWSWHLWVTDYNPTYKAAPVAGQYVYHVDGGAVHRYGGAAWTLPSGRFYNKYIMDRNLGTRDAGYSYVHSIYYQFGRKDPMPNTVYGVLYDIQGVRLSGSDPRNALTMNKDAGKGVTIATAVLNPTFFYLKQASEGHGDWSSQGKEGNHQWNHPEPGQDLKSIYDPCPAGWKVPYKDACLGFVYNPANASKSTVLNGARDPRLLWGYNGEIGLRYLPLDSNMANLVYFPSYGFRYLVTGGMSSLSDIVYNWFSTPSGIPGGYCLYSDVRGVGVGNANFRSHGFSVRCVQQ